MAQIPTYEREFSFTGHSEDYPSRPHRGDKVDAEFDAVALALAATKTALAQIRRTDGQLKNLSVGLDQLKPEVVLGTPTDWTTATEYERKDVVWRNSVLYVCNTDHTSGTFATDLAAAYWTAYLDYADPLGDAADYANAARDYRDTAGGHAASAASNLSLAVAAREAAEAAQDAAEIAAQSITLPLDTSQGGTGALNITQARSNLSVYSIAEVDALFQSVDIKDDVVCATTANITLSGEQTIDGVLTSASRVLVKNQSSGAENGVYVSAAGAWTRASDFNSWAEVVGALVTVQQGTVNADRVYYCTNNAGGTLGTTAIVFDLRASSTTGLLAGLTPAADQIPYFTGASGAALADFTAAGRALLDDATAAAQRVTLSALGVVRTQVFTSSGTYTPNANMLYCTIECVGGGGGGGGVQSAVSPNYGGGGGGGGGAYARKLCSASDIGASKTVTIGAGGGGAAAGFNTGSAGGNTSVGTLCVANGGSGGSGGGANSQTGTGGAGGSGGTGDAVIVGAVGGVGCGGVTTSVSIAGGAGAPGPFGGGAAPVLIPHSSAAATAGGNAPATGYGGGGGGGVFMATGGSDRAGGNGASGIVIITEFCTQ